MAQYNQRGFVEARKLGGSAPILKTFEVSAATNEAFFIGDAVTLQASGKLDVLKTASTTRPTGVITSLFKKSNNKPFPLTFSQPTNGPYLTSGQEGYALVNCDPAQTYIVEYGGAFTTAIVGAGVKVSAGAPDTNSGLSGQTVGTLTTSADAQFQIIGPAPIEELDGIPTSVASPALIEVIINNGTFNGGNLV